MKLEELADGVLPRSKWWRVERQQVAEYHELGHRVCSPLHGLQHDNALLPEARQYTISARCWLAGYRPFCQPSLFDT